MTKNSMTRREFIQNTGITAGAAAVSTGTGLGRSIIGANDRIGVGFIGFGIRGPFLLQAVEKSEGSEVRACCDLYDGRLQGMSEKGYPNILKTKAYEEVIQHKDIDVAIIATPDHWHKKIALDSMDAGKDIYVEKPMTYRWEDTKDFVDAVKRSGRILQVGSQQASNPVNEKALELIRSGALGNITYIAASIMRNTPTGAWYYPIPLDASEETIDWKRFIGDAPWYDYDPDRFFRWRLYWDYSGGLPTDLFVHMITLAHTLMGGKMPKKVSAMGGVFNWTEKREVPDHLSALAEYPDGYVLSLTSSANSAHRTPFMAIMGTEGALEFSDNGAGMTYYHEPINDGYWYSCLGWPEKTRQAFFEANDIDPQTQRPRSNQPRRKPETFKFQEDHLTLHMQNFFAAVRSRKQPLEDAVFGGNAATVGHMVNLSYRNQKAATWDSKTEKVII